MLNQTKVAGLGPAPLLRRLASRHAQALGQLAAGALGFAAAGASLLGGLAPFGVSLAAAADAPHATSAAVGAVLGYFCSRDPAMNMQYIAAVVLLCGLRWVMTAVFTPQRVWRQSPLYAGGALFATGVAVAAGSGLLLPDLVLAAAQGVLAGGGCYFFRQAYRQAAQGVAAAGATGRACLVVSLAILTLGLGGWQVGPLSLGRVLGALLVLLGARQGGAEAGAIAGVAVGAAAGLGGNGMALWCFALGGLMAGVFSAGGAVFGAAAFVLTGGIAALMGAAQGQSAGLWLFYECLAGGMASLLVPGKWLQQIWPQLQGEQPLRPALAQRLYATRLDRAGQALEELGQLTRQVTQTLATFRGEGIDRVYRATVDSCCRKCRSAPVCWQKQYTDSCDALSAGIQAIRQGRPAAEGFPAHFTARCPNAQALADTLQQQYQLYAQKKNARREVCSMRGVVTDQFEGLSLVLQGIRREVQQVHCCDPALGQRVSELLRGEGLPGLAVDCYSDCCGRLSVEFCLPAYKLGRLQQSGFAGKLAELCGQPLAEPEISTLGEEVRLLYCGRALLTASYGLSQRSARAGTLCGDSVDFFTDHNAQARLLLSDGMGAGKQAAMDSTITVGLIGRLLKAGIGFDAALKLANSALLVKSGEESLATVDALEVDLYTGQATFFKAGAAPSFVIKGGRAGRVESASLPAGILSGVAFEKSSLRLQAGDLVVLVSDGVTATGDGWIPSELASLRHLPLPQLCQRLLQTAADRALDNHPDDMTVLALRLEEA